MTAVAILSVTLQATRRNTVANPAEMSVDSNGKTQKSQFSDVEYTGMSPDSCATWTWQYAVSVVSNVAKNV